MLDLDSNQGPYGLTGWESLGPLARMNVAFGGSHFQYFLAVSPYEGAEWAWIAVGILEAFIADFSAELLRAAAMMRLSRKRVAIGRGHSQRAFANYGRAECRGAVGRDGVRPASRRNRQIGLLAAQRGSAHRRESHAGAECLLGIDARSRT